MTNFLIATNSATISESSLIAHQHHQHHLQNSKIYYPMQMSSSTNSSVNINTNSSTLNLNNKSNMQQLNNASASQLNNHSSANLSNSSSSPSSQSSSSTTSTNNSLNTGGNASSQQSNMHEVTPYLKNSTCASTTYLMISYTIYL